jgi:hypothetical protein
MDSTTTTAIAYCGFITSVLGVVYAAINHKRIRSNCCGKRLEASLDIDNTTPVKAAVTAPAA